MDETYGRVDPHAEIERLEARIEELATQLESCRKYRPGGADRHRGGRGLLVALVLGAIRFDPLALTAAIAAVLGGIVVSGSNGSTAQGSRERSWPRPRRTARR